MNINKKNLKKNILIAAILVLALPVILNLAAKTVLPIVNRVMGSPDLSILEDYQPIGSIEIYDFQDNFVGVLQGKEDRQVVKLNQISDYAKQAVLAAEDNEFYHHKGFSIVGFFRALSKNISSGHIVQGGSTLTQQMVKNLFIREDERYKRTLSRKIRELLIAIEVEHRYNKDKIFEIYLNQVYFGSRAYGIERASQRYFSKPSSRLNLEESAFLAGLLTAPSYLAKNKDKAFEKQKYVLERMYENGYISKAEYDKALNTKLEFKESEGNLSKYPYYFSYIEQELKRRFTRDELKRTGLKVYTGLDPVAERIAVQVLTIGIQNAAQGINQGALVCIDVDTAEVRALVGGVGDFWRFQYNRAINVHTIGSAFKPFVYLTAFMRGAVDANTIIVDEPIEVKNDSPGSDVWVPKNFDDEFHGPITARAALIFSRNIPAVKVAMKTGIKNIIETARLAGIKSPLEPVISLALGSQGVTPLELASAYSTFARGGVQIDPILIREVRDAKGRVLEINKANPKNALPERHVAQLVNIMEDVVRFGTGALANIPGRVIAGKTGTADGSRDIWFTGFTPEIVTTVWAGNEMNEEVRSRYATGGSTTAWIWKEFMENYLRERPIPVKGFTFTSDYIDVAIDPLTGLLATEYTPNPVMQRFIPGTQPTRYAPIPETGKIYTRKEKEPTFPVNPEKDVLSEEDSQMKTIESESKYEQEAKRAEAKARASNNQPKIEIIPQPKSFKIETHE